MPALGLEHPPDDLAWEIPVPTHYFAAALLAILVAIRVLFARWRTLQRPEPEIQAALDAKREASHFSPASAREKDRQKFGPDFGLGPGRQGSPTRWARGFVPLRVVSSQLRPAGTLPTMDGSKGDFGEDHYPWSALGTSRGVSTSSPPQAPHDSSDTGPSSFTVTAGTGRSRSPRTSSRASSGTRHSSSSDGITGHAPRDKGKGPMARSSSRASGSSQVMALDADAGAQIGSSRFHSGPFQDTSFPGTDLRIPRHFTRPPPPPPLTPPTLSGPFFPFEDRRPSYATSIPPALDTSFIHQPNPEYGGSTSADVLSSSPQSATPLPRRRSYTRSVPIGIPGPTTASASSSAETMTSGSTTNTFSPSSYPPTSPLLPPPPPGQYELPPSAPPEYEFVGGPGGPGIFLSQQEIDLQGEIISVMDDTGHGWKRHTRVYGGGVCLACVAATQRDDDGQGGFYGDKVPLQDRR